MILLINVAAPTHTVDKSVLNSVTVFSQTLQPDSVMFLSETLPGRLDEKKKTVWCLLGTLVRDSK